LLMTTASAQDDFSTDQTAFSTQPKIDRTQVKVVQNLGGLVPMGDVFREADGRVVRIGEILKNRPALILPIFYRCKGVCSVELQGLLATLPKLDQRIGKDFDVIVLSIDPQEGPELAQPKLASSIASVPELKGTDSGWHFLTGTLPNIRSLTNSLGFYFTYDPAKDLITHPSGLIFVTQTGAISSYILGANYNPVQLGRNVNIANANKLGAKVQDAFFGCVHIDPISGHRSIVIERFLSLFALLTVVGILTTITVLGIRSRRLAPGR
jgi:protein SCO1/2